MSAVFYWLILKPISLLPYPMLYALSDFFYVVLFYIVGYRKKVVKANIRGCFPEKTEAEVNEISKKFYRHFCDLVIESLKNFSITEAQAKSRMKQVNPEIFKPYAERGQGVILAGGHYANWELWAAGTPSSLDHRLVGIYKKLSNAYFDQKMRETRGKFGLELVATKEYSNYIKEHHKELIASVIAIDQSPSNPKKCLWIEFMGRETAALFGAEKYSKEFNIPILYGKVRKDKRGYYSVTYEVAFDNPTETQTGEITKGLHDILEKEIRRAPEFWLWSHKRWKHKRPIDENFASDAPNR
jgi:KDO2-lipid IV(A) lauroyltransferase